MDRVDFFLQLFKTENWLCVDGMDIADVLARCCGENHTVLSICRWSLVKISVLKSPNPCSQCL